MNRTNSMTKHQAAEALAEAVQPLLDYVYELETNHGGPHFDHHLSPKLRSRCRVCRLEDAKAAYDAAPPDDCLEKVREWAENGQRNVSLNPYWKHEDMQPYREVLAILEGDTPDV